jgi:hypothetical protein
MDDARLPPSFLISAQIRIAAREGIPIVVRRHGNDESGTIILKINRLDGTARVLTQVRYEDELVWNPVSRIDPMPEADADKYLDRQAAIDPDSWLLEIEDKQGRHWFPGRVMVF